jgi:hypothetical protein
MSTTPPSPDPRVNLKAGWFDAAEASWNMQVVSMTKPSEKFINPSTPGDSRLVNSDLAFFGDYVIQGNYSGMQFWNVSNPRKPTLTTAYVCPGSQSDVSVYRNLLFVSAEATSGRRDCGMQGVVDTVSNERARGIRVYDISDMAHPKPLTIVETCRGSHTNTLVSDPHDKANIYIYVSGSAQVRSPNELPGCSAAAEDTATALFRIEVIQVPLDHPELSHIVSSPRIFHDLTPATHHGESAADSAASVARAAAAGRTMVRPYAGLGPTQCHDITAYPGIGLAGGACGGYGILIDIHDPAHPSRVSAVTDFNFSGWHSVTFNNDGTKILFSDEWGGGSQPRCRTTDKLEWGADAIYGLNNGKMTFESYYKMAAPQPSIKNCVAHNGSLIPIPGRDIMVQGFYQGGITVFDWTDGAHPKEIAYFTQGPMDSTKLIVAGYWSAYWYNGYIYGSEIARGLHVFDLKPSGFLSQNEIDAAKSVRFDWENVQGQPMFIWPPSFSVPRSYLDQLVRNNGIASDRATAISSSLNQAQKMSGEQRTAALNALATQLDADAQSAADAPRVRAMATAVRDLASGQPLSTAAR